MASFHVAPKRLKPARRDMTGLGSPATYHVLRLSPSLSPLSCACPPYKFSLESPSLRQAVSEHLQSGVVTVSAWSTNSPEYLATALSSSNPSSYIVYTGDNYFLCDSTATQLSFNRRQPNQTSCTVILPFSTSMSSLASKLSGIARAKLHSAVGSSFKDTCSLHRWVLLKNSIVRSQPSSPISTESTAPFSVNVYRQNGTDEDTEEECEGEEPEEEDAFVFPDPDALLDISSDADTTVSEAQWLDSLLETLTDDIRDDDTSTGSHDEDYAFFSPSVSSFSSAEDLVNNSNFYQPTPIAVPYPIPYPPLFHPPLIHSEDFRCSCDVDDEERKTEDGLPYYDVDDLDDLSVPEAIEDTSDDESETLTTPLCRSSSSIGIDPASVPLPPDGRRPHVYIDMDDPFLYHLRNLDALPFARSSREYESAVLEC